MPEVVTTTLIHAPYDTVYEVARRNEEFPQFMKDVQSLQIIEEDGDRVVSDWVGLVSSFNLKVRWRQEDIWDKAAGTCKFRQLEGDYDALEGTWSFRSTENGVRFDSVLTYEYVVPTLGPLVKKIVHSLVEKNMEGVLAAIKERAEARSSSDSS